MSPQVGDIVVYVGNAYGHLAWAARRDSGQRYIVVRATTGGSTCTAYPLRPFIVPDDKAFTNMALTAGRLEWEVVSRASYESTEGPAHLIDAEGDVWIEGALDAFALQGSLNFRRSLQEVIDRYGLAAARR